MAIQPISNQENNFYLSKIRKLPFLSYSEEYHLAKEWQDKQEIKSVQKLVASHLKLVAKIAHRYRGYGLPLSDLISEGNIGIMQAIKHYDPERGYRFATYALWWIKATIQDYILNNWSLIKIGRTTAFKKLFFNLRKTQQSLDHADENSDLTENKIKTIAEKLNVKEEEVMQMYQRLRFKDYSLNQPFNEEREDEWIEWIADERENQEVQLAYRDEYSKRKKIMNDAFSSLSEREHKIMLKRRLSEPPFTLEQVATEMNLSRERIRQIEEKAFLKLQKSIKRQISKPSWKHL